jgi:hypothetical protein
MAPETVHRVVETVCAEAVKIFARRLSAGTNLHLVVTERQEGAGVEFFDESTVATKLHIQWNLEETLDADPVVGWKIYTGESCEFSENGKVLPQMIEHYKRTVDALARNANAARAFLKDKA